MGDVAHKCKIPSFRVDMVDVVVWNWVIQLLTNPETLEEGINLRLTRNEKESAPLRERLAIAVEMLEDNNNQLARLVDLYIAGGFEKDVLTDRKKRLEESIKALEREKESILAILERTTLIHKQIKSIYEFAERIGKGIASAEANPKYQRQIIEALDVRVIFAIEEGKKVLYAQCVLDSEPVMIGIQSTTKR